MDRILHNALQVAIMVFMVGSLLEVGLRVRLKEAAAALHDLHFVALALLFCFILGPLFAVLLTKVLPLAAPYALGLVLLGLVPCSPACPMFVSIARGSLAYLTALMLMAYLGTVLIMPLAVPYLAPGFTADSWTIEKPLLYFVALPLAIGATFRQVATTLADAAAFLVRKVTGIVTACMVVLAVWIYRSDLVSSFGTFAIAAQILYYGILGAVAYGLAFRLKYEQKAVLAIGVGTRNVGPALAPLFAIPGTDPRAIAMCVLAAFLGAILSGFTWAFALKAVFAPAQSSLPKP
jgi:bile acid:Na+ symporter, BASS family